ncbi:FCD domain-containing protein [Streptomyces sp. UC4497]
MDELVPAVAGLVATNRPTSQAEVRLPRGLGAAIAEAAGNRFLVATIDPLGAHIQRFRRFTGGRITDTAEALAEHAAVLSAFESDDATARETAMRTHLEGVAHRFFGH